MTQFIDPTSKLFGHLDRLAAIKRGEKPAPVNVEIFLSCRCSHGCSWCQYAYTHTRGPLVGKQAKPKGAISSGDLMDTQFAYRLMEHLAECGVKSITVTGGGEPTLHPDFDSIVSSAVGNGLEVGLYTHGGHLLSERAELLKQNATWVYVSLDECDRESFKASKGVDRFHAVMDGVHNLVAAEGKATVGLGFLLHRGNYSRVHDMVTLGRDHGVDYVQFRPTVQFSMDAPGKVAEDTDWVNWAVKYLRTFERDPFVIADIGRFAMYRDWQGHGYSTCYWSALQTAISPNGRVWRCTNKTENPNGLLGDLRVESFADLWRRSGGACDVDSQCRTLCRGHLANITLNEVMTPMAHGNFI